MICNIFNSAHPARGKAKEHNTDAPRFTAIMQFLFNRQMFNFSCVFPVKKSATFYSANQCG
jgi:hypothetical protein